MDRPQSGRDQWFRHRLELERHYQASRLRHTIVGVQRLPPRSWRFVQAGVTRWVVTAIGLWRRGRRNAEALRINEVEFSFADLPRAFDGYRILHFSDLHVGAVADQVQAISRLGPALAADLAVFTGDYQTFAQPSAAVVAAELRRILDLVQVSDGAVGTLGNHDSAHLAEPLEQVGLRLLINEAMTLRRGTDTVTLVGTDDVHSFHTPDAAMTLRSAGTGFRIALVHTADLATVAAAAGFGLYLTGHTHGGQICLPGERPVMTMLDSHHHLAVGKWRWHGMWGYTSRGVGASRPQVRFNSHPEIVAITLRRAPSAR